MARKQYPHVTRSRAYDATVKGANRCFCGAVATHRVEISVSFFLGDDEVRPRCDEHLNSTSLEKWNPSIPKK